MNPRDWRLLSKVSQAGAARLVGVAGTNPARTWQRYETGQSQPRASLISTVEVLSAGKVTARDWALLRQQYLFRSSPEKPRALLPRLPEQPVA